MYVYIYIYIYIYTYIDLFPLIGLCVESHIYIYILGIGWLRLVSSLKL